MVTTVSCPTARPELAQGSTGASVVAMQQAVNARLAALGAPGALTLVADGDFGPKTLKAVKYIQCVAFLAIDGIVGPNTWGYICNGENSLPRLFRTNPQNNAAMLKEVQRLLKADGYYAGAVDGIFGAQTEAAVKAYQRDSSLTQDGIVGPNTWMKLVLRKVRGGSCNA
jgi:peptidoglycan hydrolase-like protein with peptidoglycan-binding domain